MIVLTDVFFLFEWDKIFGLCFSLIFTFSGSFRGLQSGNETRKGNWQLSFFFTTFRALGGFSTSLTGMGFLGNIGTNLSLICWVAQAMALHSTWLKVCEA